MLLAIYVTLQGNSLEVRTVLACALEGFSFLQLGAQQAKGFLLKYHIQTSLGMQS